MDFPLLEIAKKDNKFIIRAIHSDEPDKIFEYKFDYGEYDTNVVFKRNDIKRDYVPIPIHIKYDGGDKILSNVGDEFPENQFPISV